MSSADNYDQIVIEAITAAINAAYATLREHGHEIIHEGRVMHTEIHEDVMWGFIRLWGGYPYSPFLKLIDFEGLLYPEDSGEFVGQVIPPQVAEVIINRAKALLGSDENEDNSLPTNMKDHLRNIVENGMPYGVKVAAE